ncbi:MAG: tRNA (N(6)-L-threonylcarbamoyladenosine(37)-C(2))-methylthiotransferase MtaB [Chlorobi bacterium]|nr:tRNA (N(6)-L-threonylcarbamoyladenosine(37)-C(2))-methylthiotransferase MtaB [Chlorobiota bacterium]
MKGKKLKAAFHTLGCKLNFSETSTLGQKFLENGFDIIQFNEAADVYVINTCTVTDNADKECRQIVRRALRKNPNAYVIVTGCYAQLRPEEISRIEGVDLALGSNEKFKIFDYAGDFKKNNFSCVYVSPTETLNEFNSAYSTDADSRTRAFFKIQDGCDYKCTFCTIPLARGKSRSQSPEQLVADFKNLLQKGYKEIILTGVNVGDYGKNVGYDLYGLLKDFISIEDNFRIRISSIEPNLLTEDIIRLTAESEKLAKHFHIPLQSGSDKVLRLMKRRYDSSLYEKLIYKVKEIIPEAGIGVDVIVGTPGETEEDFLTTYEFIKKLPVSYLHVFTYSERPNTEAILMDGKVEQAEKKRRNGMLRILGEKKKTAFYKEQIGKELKVLFEHTEKEGTLEGFSSNYVRVKGASNFDLVNRLTNVKIVNANGEYCYSE